jgi:hypothetical protein
MECDFRSSLKQEVMRATNSRAHFLMRWPQANKSSQPQMGIQISDSPMNSRHSSNGSILSSLREWYINEFLYRFWHAGTVCKSKKKKIQLTSFKTVPIFKNKDLETKYQHLQYWLQSFLPENVKFSPAKKKKA